MHKTFFYLGIAAIFSIPLMAGTEDSTDPTPPSPPSAANPARTEVSRARRLSSIERDHMAIAIKASLDDAAARREKAIRDQEETDAAIAASLADSPRRGRSASPRRAAAGAGRAASPACRAVARAAETCHPMAGARASGVPSTCDLIDAMMRRCNINAHNPGFTDKEIAELRPYVDGRL